MADFEYFLTEWLIDDEETDLINFLKLPPPDVICRLPVDRLRQSLGVSQDVRIINMATLTAWSRLFRVVQKMCRAMCDLRNLPRSQEQLKLTLRDLVDEIAKLSFQYYEQLGVDPAAAEALRSQRQACEEKLKAQERTYCQNADAANSRRNEALLELYRTAERNLEVARDVFYATVKSALATQSQKSSEPLRLAEPKRFKDLKGSQIFGLQHLCKTPTDLSEDPLARTLAELGPSVTFTINRFCPNGDRCRSKTRIRDFKEFSLPGGVPTVAAGFDYILGRVPEICDTCLDSEGYRLVGYNEIAIKDPKKPALFLFVNTASLGFSPEEYMLGPQELSIQNIKYRPLCIQLNNKRTPDHYRTLIRAGERQDSSSWLLFDGQANTSDVTSKLRPALPFDFANRESSEGYYPTWAIYIKA